MPFYRRFSAYDRVLHVLLMASFLGLSMTGLPLLFHDAVWASRLATAIGGVQAAGRLHRASAVLLIGVFVAHLLPLARRLLRGDLSVLWGPTSMVPQPRDVADLYRHVLWFLGLGPRPRFGRYTYWEKFDYWAVFWGMGIIGLSGLMLWIPTFFARLVPGWIFNVALLVHGEEALLAVVFIFTVHFFNTHLRPEKFPMDLVIFTGGLTEDELRTERPEEYDWLRANGALDALQTDPPPAWIAPLGRWIAAVVLSLGFAVVGLTVLTLVRAR
jgi:cytochrome b subunit of formate dehydrogenase